MESITSYSKLPPPAGLDYRCVLAVRVGFSKLEFFLHRKSKGKFYVENLKEKYFMKYFKLVLYVNTLCKIKKDTDFKTMDKSVT